MNTPQRILVFRTGSIGNTLAAVPAIKCLRKSFPFAHIGIVVDPIGRELLANLPYVNETFVYDRHGENHGAVGYLKTAFMLRATRPDTAVLFKRFFRTGMLARMSGAERRVGFMTNQKAPFQTESIPYDETIHIVDLNVRLVESIGAHPVTSLQLEIFLTENEIETARSWLTRSGIVESYIIAHFGGITSGARFVNNELRIELLRTLGKNRQVIMIGSGVVESEEARMMVAVLPNAVQATNIPLRLTMALIKLASGFVGTNSGPLHIASAAQIPGIVLYNQDHQFEIERVKWAPKFSGLQILPIPSAYETHEIVSQAAQLWKTK